MAIQFTEKAITELKKIFDEQKLDPVTSFIRCGVKGGGCSGFSYTLDITDNKNESDEEFMHDNNFLVLCDPKSYIYLNGLVVDFKDEIMGRGFVFNNPNSTHTCGCGSSFSA